MNYEELLAAYNALKKENVFLRSEIDRLSSKTVETQSSLFEPEAEPSNRPPEEVSSKININSKPEEKIELFMSLF